jgi:hypothetical protein
LSPILTAIAYPSYRNYVIRATRQRHRRPVGGQANMERYFQDNRTYVAANGFITAVLAAGTCLRHVHGLLSDRAHRDHLHTAGRRQRQHRRLYVLHRPAGQPVQHRGAAGAGRLDELHHRLGNQGRANADETHVERALGFTLIEMMVTIRSSPSS